ncbi:putative carboxylesterase [Rosa chinensis]|uniref:Putative carboxylesterase n=1 Tax=Rosa chinensis TaxID=74649 RepID=A0A2P6SAN7_ROSCH|nr:probable carboxylesterase 15 [Rosa chinensis]PRQ55734.1 putative carboxylesterase [Rosa chinensis]
MVQEKKVVIQVSDWLRVYDDGSVDRTWTGLPEFTFLFHSVSPHEEFINGVATKDVVIDKTSDHRVRIYLPERKPEDNDDTKLPIILHFHGGGFCISEADWYMYYYIYSKITRAANAIVVSVYLRQAPEHRLPAQIDDSFSALLWLRSVAQADSYEPWLNEHANLNRIFLIGDSSGGNIVHEVAARAGNADLGQFKLSGGILIQPGFVRVTRSKSELEQPQTSFFNVDMVDKLFSFSLPMGSTKDHRITCPMGSLAPPLDSLKLPPMLIFIGGIDIFQDTEMEYYEAMKKANHDVQLLTIPGMRHAFYLNADMDPRMAAPTESLVSGVVEFVKKH